MMPSFKDIVLKTRLSFDRYTMMVCSDCSKHGISETNLKNNKVGLPRTEIVFKISDRDVFFSPNSRGWFSLPEAKFDR